MSWFKAVIKVTFQAYNWGNTILNMLHDNQATLCFQNYLALKGQKWTYSKDLTNHLVLKDNAMFYDF